MGLLPESGDDLDLMELQLEEQPGRTHRIDLQRKRVAGQVEGQEAIRQAVYLILNTERYAYPIYSRNYGVELADLVGQPRDLVLSEVKRRITEALDQDDRILNVDGWEFEESRRAVTVRFTVHTAYGALDMEKEVEG